MKVHASTLRQWADNRQIRTFRTAGGHRRFLLDDLNAMLEGHAPTQLAATSLEEDAVRRIRRRLHGEHTTHAYPWLDRLSPEGRVKLRLFGRRLLDLSLIYLGQKRRRPEVLSEVQMLAEEYGQQLAQVNIALDQVLEAFIFFRNPLFEAVRESVQNGQLRGMDPTLVWQQVEQVSDHMLLSMIRAYERSLHVAVNGNQVAVQASGG